jgi:hypothetical protein
VTDIELDARLKLIEQALGELGDKAQGIATSEQMARKMPALATLARCMT